MNTTTTTATADLSTTATTARASRVRSRVRRLALSGVGSLMLVGATMAPAAAGEIRPDPTPRLPGGLQGKLNTGLGLAMGVAVFAAVLGVIIVAFLLFLAARRGSLEDHMGRLGAVMAGCVLLGGASSLVMFLI